MKLHRRPQLATLLLATISLIAAPWSIAHAGRLGATAMSIACGTKITVTDANDGDTLTIDPSDPILSGACGNDGLVVVNSGSNAINRSFSIDCQTNQATPISGGKSGTGILLLGPNLAVFNCYVQGFGAGIVAHGDDADIEDSQVQNAAGDGFVVKDGLSILNQNLYGTTITGDIAIDNGGWGFDLKGNAISGGTGSVFNNIADGNVLGGFSVKGDGNALSGSEAYNNGGPGFDIVSNSCCSGSFGQSFDTAVASLNRGPGIIYVGRDDGSNCVGSNSPTCAGGVFFPAGFDTTPGGITGADNGSCPAGSLPFLAAEGVCPRVKGKPCSQSVLDRCP